MVIFVSDTSIARKLHLPGVRKFELHKHHTPLFGSDFGICITQKQRTFEDQDLIIIEVKKYLH